MSKIDEYLKSQGFIFQTNEIYGGIKGMYDYGHLGTLLKKNIQRRWEHFFVMKNPDVYLMDPCILGAEDVYIASGHLQHFNDVYSDCKNCKKRYRPEQLPTSQKCPNCDSNNWTSPKEFNLTFRLSQNNLYLRPETAQSIFINFKNFMKIYSPKLPFGIGCVGKSFRNEVTLGNTIYRTKEFEQMELEWFTHPRDSNIVFKNCLDEIEQFLNKELGFTRNENYELREVSKAEMAHYSKNQTDIYFKFPWGWEEIWGIAHRGEFDLKSHQDKSGKSMEYLDSEKMNTKYIPNVIEHSVGLNRLMYAVVSTYLTETPERTILAVPKELSPYEFCIIPLTKEEIPLANTIYKEFLEAGKRCWFLKRGSIGKRYKKNDEIGTYYCVTIDKGSRLNAFNPSFTVRHRDTAVQKEYDLNTVRNNGFIIDF